MTEYSEKHIKSLTDLEHARIRPALYIGDTTVREIELPVLNENLSFVKYPVCLGYVVCIREVIDNAIDIIKHTKKGKYVWINFDDKTKRFTIKDDSVGVPIGRFEKTDKYTPEIVFSTLRSGKNFGTDKFIIGMNGMGAALTNFFSKEFTVTIWRDKTIYKQKWKAMKSEGPDTEKYDGKFTGTQISFKLDKKYFNWEPDAVFVEHFVKLLAAFNSDIKFKYNNKVVYTKGVRDCKAPGTFYRKASGMEIAMRPNHDESEDYKLFTVVNGIPTLYGGTHADEIERYLINVVKHLVKTNQIIHKANILKGLSIIFKIDSLPNIMFDSQAKTRLITPAASFQDKDTMNAAFDAVLSFVRNQKKGGWLPWIEEQFERRTISKRLHARRKKNGRTSYFPAKSFKDAEIYIVEGGSAMAELKSIRSDNQGILPLRGKIMNVSGRRLSDVVKSETVVNLIDCLGIDVAGGSNCKYERIILATDADPDGLHIQSLLINLLHRLAPELLDKVYILSSPLYVWENRKKYEIFYTKEEFDNFKRDGGEVMYKKGLGSLTRKEWAAMVDPKRRALTKVTESNRRLTGETLNRLFGINTAVRREWLTGTKSIWEI